MYCNIINRTNCIFFTLYIINEWNAYFLVKKLIFFKLSIYIKQLAAADYWFFFNRTIFYWAHFWMLLVLTGIRFRSPNPKSEVRIRIRKGWVFSCAQQTIRTIVRFICTQQTAASSRAAKKKRAEALLIRTSPNSTRIIWFFVDIFLTSC